MAEIKFDISEVQIQNAIAVAIAESFSPDRNAQIVRDIVRAHLSYKENSYDKETILSKVVGTMIRTIAVDEVQKIIKEKEMEIRSIVRRTLGESFTDSVFIQLQASLSHKVISQIQITANLCDSGQ